MTAKTKLAATLDDQQAEIPDIIKYTEAALEALRHAETCETADDFKGNAQEAVGQLTAALAELRPLARCGACKQPSGHAIMCPIGLGIGGHR